MEITWNRHPHHFAGDLKIFHGENFVVELKISSGKNVDVDLTISRENVVVTISGENEALDLKISSGENVDVDLTWKMANTMEITWNRRSSFISLIMQFGSISNRGGAQAWAAGAWAPALFQIY